MRCTWFELEFFMYVVQKCDVCQLHMGGNILVDARIEEPSASDVVQNLTTVAFH